jgi:aerobic-type carbon monoxide dehydrogenase small subunit (CoxS/CutS family)
MTGRFVRIAEFDRPSVEIEVNGARCAAKEGDTLLVAVLTHVATLRDSEFGDGARAGFCLMGACQDCWMWTPAGDRVRACTTFVAPGMSVITHQPAEATWPTLG